MHEAERIVLRDSPYLILVHDSLIYLTRTDTWTGYVPSPEPDGAPFSTSWLQLQIIEPGQAASSSYAGAPIALDRARLLCVVAAFVTSRWRRRKEESGPLELAPVEGDRASAARSQGRPTDEGRARRRGRWRSARSSSSWSSTSSSSGSRATQSSTSGGTTGSHPQQQDALIEERGLREPLLTQFRIYVADTVSGDLDTSYSTGRPGAHGDTGSAPEHDPAGRQRDDPGGADRHVARRGGRARRRGRASDTAITQGSLILYSMPEFWLGMVLIWLFASTLGAFPTGLKSDPGADLIGYRIRDQRRSNTPRSRSSS